MQKLISTREGSGVPGFGDKIRGLLGIKTEAMQAEEKRRNDEEARRNKLFYRDADRRRRIGERELQERMTMLQQERMTITHTPELRDVVIRRYFTSQYPEGKRLTKFIKRTQSEFLSALEGISLEPQYSQALLTLKKIYAVGQAPIPDNPQAEQVIDRFLKLDEYVGGVVAKNEDAHVYTLLEEEMGTALLALLRNAEDQMAVKRIEKEANERKLQKQLTHASKERRS